MRSNSIVIQAPGFDLGLRILEIDKPVLVETFISELAVEAFDVGILYGPSRPDEVQLNAVLVSPDVKSSAGELGSVIHDDEFWQTVGRHQTIEDSGDALSWKRGVHFDGRALAPEVIDDVERAESPARG